MLLVNDTKTRFGLISVFLHWYVAVAVLFLLTTGLLIYYVGPHGALRPLRADLTFFHMSVALTSIPFFIARILWRFSKGKPKSHNLQGPIRLTADVVWRLLLVGIIWQMIWGPFIESLNWFGIMLGRLSLPWFLEWADDHVETLHLFGGVTIASLLVLHIGGALKHYFIDRDRVLQNMLRPVVPDEPPAERTGRSARNRTLFAE